VNESRIRMTVASLTLFVLAATRGLHVSAADSQAAAGACALLTQAQISGALGLKVDAGARPVESDPSICNWREEGKPTGPGRNVMLTVINASGFGEAKSRLSGALPQPGLNLGDDAFFQKSGRFPVTLFLKKGTQYFRIMARTQVTAPTGTETAVDADIAVEEKIAADLLKNL
jgi:hypothetical protein